MPPNAGQRHVIAQFMSITGAQERVASTFCKKYGWKLDQACDAVAGSPAMANSGKNSKRGFGNYISDLSLLGNSEETHHTARRASKKRVTAAINTSKYTSSERYFQQNQGAGATLVSEKVDAALTKLFEKYRDTKNDEKDTIGIDGTMAYLTELGVNLENASSLIPLEITQAPALGELTKDEFVNGWKKVSESASVDTVGKQKSYIAQQTALLSNDMALFKRIYKHTFVCSKERGQKALPLENAIIYWQLLFSPPGRKWATASANWLDLWLDFLRKKWTKSVNKDMWNQTFEFFQKSMQDETLSFWSEDGAWPSVIDDFVAYYKEQRSSQASDKMETD